MAMCRLEHKTIYTRKRRFGRRRTRIVERRRRNRESRRS